MCFPAKTRADHKLRTETTTHLLLRTEQQQLMPPEQDFCDKARWPHLATEIDSETSVKLESMIRLLRTGLCAVLGPCCGPTTAHRPSKLPHCTETNH